MYIRLIFILLFLPLAVFSQSKGELQKKKKKIQEDIEYTNMLLDRTKKSKSSSMNQLVTLNKKISYRHELITTISSEINSVDKEINNVETSISSLNTDLNKLKKQYSSMLYFAYKNQSAYSKVMFVFSADGFNQAYKRMLYLKQLSEYRLRQRDMLVTLQDSLSGKKNILQEEKQTKNMLLTTQEKQVKKLDSEKKQQVTLLNSLASKEKKLRKDLKAKQKSQQQLASKIEAIIRKEIAAARKADLKNSANATASKSSSNIKSSNSASILLSTPEAKKLNAAFENNKGILPWPVEKGIISSSFGRRVHPVWKDVVVNNNGVDINSSQGAKARAIFEGKVIQVIIVLDHYAVLVQHGEYFTLYSNLSQVYVKRNDKVITKQPIGTIQTNEEDGKTELHLEIWRGGSKMDPEAWIASK